MAFWSAASVSRSGYRVGAILALIASVPLLGTVWFAASEVTDARSEQRYADEVAETAADLVGLVELKAELAEERNWVSAERGIVDIGLTAEFVARLTGIDIGAERVGAARNVDRLVGELELDDVAVELAATRASDPTTITELGDRYDAIESGLRERRAIALQEVLEYASRIRDQGDLIAALRLLDVATEARNAASAEFTSFFAAQFFGGDVRDAAAVDLIRAGANRRSAVDRLSRIVRPGTASALALDALAAPEAESFDWAVDQLVERTIDKGEDGDNGFDLISSARLFESASFNSDAFLGLVLAAGDDVRVASDQAAATAASRNQRAMVVLTGMFVISAAVAIAASRSIGRPIQALADMARRIRDGTTTPDMHVDGGPAEIREASRALSEAADQLKLAERQALALAEGDLRHDSLGQTGTGTLGASLQSAVRTLAASLEEGEEYRRKMAYEASHDGLTNLANRNASLRQIEQGLARSRLDESSLAVLFIDLDGFKGVNDQYGHAIGDQVLQAVAARLGDSVRDGDTVGRLGGDEFLVIAEPVVDEDEAVALAERIRDAVRLPIDVDGTSVAIDACVGIVLGSDDGDDPSSLLQQADLAVYRAKALGRGHVEVCDEEMRATIAEQLDVEHALRSAIERDELELWFQPVVSAASGRTSGYEALLRWERPGYGLVPPDRFIPIAERSDLIIEIDRWVASRAVHQIGQWNREGVLLDTPVSINVSGRHLASPTFVADVASPLVAAGVGSERLIVEVTESALLEDIAAAAAKLQRLRDMGVRVAIDDFGTGFTSLAHLRNLPIDILKIDRSFTNDEEAMSLVQLIVDSGHLLGATVTAEGIESEEQAERLRGMGVDTLQGFVYGCPIPAADVVDEHRDGAALRVG